MKVLGEGLTRRGWLKRLAVAAAVLPVVKLGKVVNDTAERRRHQRELEDPANFWIGHLSPRK